MTHAVLIDNYPMGPGCDFVTGSIIGPVIDTGIDVDQYSRWGRVYLSADTVAQYAGMIGWHPAGIIDELNESIDELVRRVREVEAENETLRAAGDLLTQLAAIAAEIPDKGGDVSGDGSVLSGSDSSPDTTDDEILAFPHHKGRGWFDLSDGSTVRGEEAALEAQAAIDAGDDDES